MKTSLAFLVLSIVSMPAFAQSKGKRPVLTFDEIDIEGEVQKPDIKIIMSRMNLDKAYELKLKESFIPKIKESIKKKPF